MVRMGDADGSISGAVHTTPDVVRSALRLIGPDGQTKLVSSFFLMIMPATFPGECRAMIFADCGLNVDPNAEQLAEIASASADSARQLLGQEPRIALLSFSTRGSAQHPKVGKVEQAGVLLQAMRPDLSMDAAIQVDAAIIPDIAQAKAPGSALGGNANVLIFPDLDSGNIAYKIAERIGGATAIGPILQGLAKPANDLSRGCNADDVFAMIAVTAIQAQASRNSPRRTAGL